MEKSQKFYLSLFLAFIFFGCQTNQEKAIEASEFGFHFYQGDPTHMNAFAYALELDSTNAENWRELSVTYLKRGIPHNWKKYYDKAIEHDPITWQPWRGYLYLWFYRDYKKAIADFNASDTLTPNFIDAPQGHSVDYWRGIAYLGLKNYEKSNWYFEKHIKKETKDFGEDYVDLTAFLYNGISYFESGDYEKALLNFNKQLEYGKNLSADAKFYKAQIFRIENKTEEAKIIINSAIEDFNAGYFNNRNYVETLRQIYLEDLNDLKKQLIN